MAKTFGVGIMGAGNISSAYLRLAPMFKGLEVRAVADILPAAAQRRADEFGVKAQTPDELLKNSEIDVIVNLTIPSTHYSVSMDIVSSGKHARRRWRLRTVLGGCSCDEPAAPEVAVAVRADVDSAHRRDT